MSDSYQAIYDAVRSKIGSCYPSEAIERAAATAFDMGNARALLIEQICIVGDEIRRPSVLMRTQVYPDGNMWCALYGEDLQMGVAGFGKTPAEACSDFDKNWNRQAIRILAKTANQP